MAEPGADHEQGKSSNVWDARSIHRLVRLMKQYDLSVIDIVEGSSRIRLRRGGAVRVASAPAAPAAAEPAPAFATSPAAAAPAPAAVASTSGLVIESPMVGTFYSAAAPDAPAFVNVGSVVRPETTVCVIEAMKVFTDIPAGVSGTITEVLVKNGQAVEFGLPLFRVAPSA